MSEVLSTAVIKREDFTLSKGLAPRPGPVRHDSNLDRNDILFALFKHKRKIIVCAAAGLLAGAAVYFLYPPVYESQAKLLVRYLVERSSVDAIDNSAGRGATQLAENALGSEIEILTSWDLALQAAEAVGVKRLLPNTSGVPTKEAAATVVAKGLEVGARKGSNIIFVSYQNRNPQLATLVLNELVNRYFNKHLEVHRSAGAFDFVTQQTDQVRARLNQTEDALKDVKQKAGIVSLTDSNAALSAEVTRTEDQLHAAEAELAEQQARVRQMGGSFFEKSGSGGPSKQEAKPDQLDRFGRRQNPAQPTQEASRPDADGITPQDGGRPGRRSFR